MATAVNDFIQGMIMLVGICAVIASVLAGNGGFSAAIESLSQIPSESAPGLNGAFISFLGPQPIYLLGVVLLTSLGTWGLPQMVGKFYAIRSEAAIRKGTVISTVFAIIVAGGCYFLGGFGRPVHAGIPSRFDDRSCHHPGALGLYVHPFLAGAHFRLHLDAGYH